MHSATWKKYALATITALPIFGLPATGSAQEIRPTSTLAIGSSSLAENRDITRIAPGVTLTTITRGTAGPGESWTLYATSTPSGSLFDSQKNALAAQHSFAATRVLSQVEAVSSPRFADVEPAVLGYRVRIGSYRSLSEARSAQRELTASGVNVSSPRHTTEDASQPTGPWKIRVLTIDPKRFAGTLAAAHGASLAAATPTSQIATRAGAIAAINGGFFTTSRKDGIPGEPVGLHAERGRVISEATAGRVAAVLADGGKRTRIGALSSTTTLTDARGGEHPIDGINRAPGRIPNCGGDSKDQPTALPLHDSTCRDSDELIVFTPEFGAPVQAGAGTTAIIDSSGTVTGIRDANGETVPPGGWILQGIGTEATWLDSHLHAGDKISIKTTVRTDSGQPINLGSQDSVISGGPQLISSGRIEVRPKADGLIHEDPEFFWNWGIQRSPRSMIGTTKSGQILLVTADGRQPESSVGLTLLEAADVMKSLGAVSAMNLDGGGSTTMVAESRVVNTPSDANTERVVGSALVAVPSRHTGHTAE